MAFNALSALPKFKPRWWHRLGILEPSQCASDLDDGASDSSSLEAEISSTIAPSEAGDNSYFFDRGPPAYATVGIGNAMSRLRIYDYDTESAILCAGSMFDDSDIDLNETGNNPTLSLNVSQWQSRSLAPINDIASTLSDKNGIQSPPTIEIQDDTVEDPLGERHHAEEHPKDSSGDAISLVLSKEAEEQPVLLGVRFCEFDPDEYYKEDDRTGNGITGSETESSNIDGTKGSRETDSTVDSSISKELQGQFIYTVDIDLSGMNPGGQNLDRLAICFDKGSIELLGKTNILPQHKNYARIIPGEEEQSIPSTSYAEKIDQSQGADVSTLTSGSELDPPSSKTLSSDETDFDDWLSEFLEDDPVLEEGHPFLRHKTEIIAHALRSFRLVLQASRCPAGHSDGDSRTSTVEGTTSLTTTSSGKNSRKRSTNDTEKGDDKENGDDRGSNNGRKPPKKARVNDGVQSRNFACVFYKSNPLQHVRCLHFQLKRIRDVKQHLSRCHRQPRFYCPICFETFDDSDLRNAHIRQRMCLTRDPPNWEGVSEAQGQLLRERVSRSNTPDEQWFTIWEIVFPGAPRPSSPYLGNAFEETIDRLREYWNAEGRQVVSSSLRRHGMLNWGRPGEERDLGIFHSQTLDSIITVLLAAFVSAMAPATESSASNNSAVASDSTSVDPMLIMTPSASASSGSVARSGLDVPINPMPLPATDFESDNRVMSSVPMPADAEETTDATLLVDFQSPEFGTLYVSIEAQQLLEEGDVYADWTQDF